MPRSRRCLSTFALLAALGLIGGCADYLNNRDTVALAAGDSVNANLAKETIDPWPRAAGRTTGLGSDAGRASDYIKSRNGSGKSSNPVTINVATGGGATTQ